MTDDEVELWLREALEAAYGATSLRALDRRTRAVVFQRVCGVLYLLQDEPGDLAFVPEIRSVVAAAFARYFGGVVVDGPPWSLSPAEATDDGRLTRDEYLASLDFCVGCPTTDGKEKPRCSKATRKNARTR